MSEYLSKKAVLEWLTEQYFHGMGEEAWNTAISKLQEKIESGAFDADESEGTWKATAEVLGRENAQLDSEIQRLRAELCELEQEAEQREKLVECLREVFYERLKKEAEQREKLVECLRFYERMARGREANDGGRRARTLLAEIGVTVMQHEPR